MKIYIASLIAISDLIAEGDDRPASISMSIPALIPAQSIEAAAEQAKKFAFDKWKPEEGWHTHQATIMAVTEAFYEAASAAALAGILDMSEEEGQTFNFDQ